MASNVDKVEEKVEEELEKAIKSSKTSDEKESKLDRQDVRYKIWDETKQAKKEG